jgi:hypothetical protein
MIPPGPLSLNGQLDLGLASSLVRTMLFFYKLSKYVNEINMII